jgi:GH24 family phage-related lysozyme (muramidase)
MQIIPPLQTEKLAFTPNAETGGGSRLPNGTSNDAGSFVGWLKQIEAPYKNSDYILDSSGKRIAIKPHNSNDGYITVGYGHAIQSDEDAIKHGFKTGSKQTVSAVSNSITKQLAGYKSYKDNPAILTLQEAEDLLKADLVKYQTKASVFAKETGLTFSQNEMDGITSLVYNGNRAYDPDSLLYHFLQKDKKGAMNVLQKAVENGWYGSNEGLLRRRLMEFNIFFNNDYTFYDSNELEKLKNDVGF